MVNVYTACEVSTAIQQSSEAGALLKNGSYGARGRAFSSESSGGGVGGGERIVGGAGGGYGDVIGSRDPSDLLEGSVADDDVSNEKSVGSRCVDRCIVESSAESDSVVESVPNESSVEQWRFRSSTSGSFGKVENGVCIGNGKLADEFRSGLNARVEPGACKAPELACGSELGRENGNTSEGVCD